MKRREATKTLFLFTLGSGILFSCKDPYLEVKNLGLSQIKFNKKDLQLIDELGNLILPIRTIKQLQEHTSLPFVMKSLNDLYNVDKRAFIENTYKNWDEYTQQLNDLPWSQSDEESKLNFIKMIHKNESIAFEKVKSTKEKVKFFLDLVKKENELYLSTCEFILREKRAYEMAPGRFDGAFPITKLQD